ncbi:hypothetical protein ElyMa_006013500, partial [Elysia marginata]
ITVYSTSIIIGVLFPPDITVYSTRIIIGVLFPLDITMLKTLLMVCLSLAIMAVYIESTSSFDKKQLSANGLLATGDGMDMEDVEMTISKRPATSTQLPYACIRTCHCPVMSPVGCRYCEYLKWLCCKRYNCPSEA